MNFTLITVIGFSIIFIATTLGSALVFLFKNEISKKLNSVFLGLSAGIMIASSIWSLLLPSIEESSIYYGSLKFLPPSISFFLGGLFLVFLDRIIPVFYINKKDTTKDKKTLKMFIAITIHNIPEGLAVGFAFGAANVIGTYEAFFTALGLAIGIAIQNMPEGAAVSLPLKKITNSNVKSFLYGMSSGIVEPIAAIIGYLLASFLISFQPWFLSFAAGAMIFVVVEDLIPETKLENNYCLGSLSVMIGFTIMMILDVAL